jgi:aryl-alcohol dehydrogenase-like predicted oxidoreductase
MIYQTIANTDLKVSALGLGTVKLGRNQQVKYPSSFQIPDDKQAKSLLDCARDSGINLLDTAPAYGNSEQRLGQLLKGQRHHWLLCTKVGEEFEAGQSYYDFSPEHIHYSIKRSLQRLNTDYLDIVLVHSDGQDEAIIKQWCSLATLAELKAQGLIRAFGMSSKTLAGGLLAASQSDLVMLTYNLQQQQELPVIQFAQQHQVGVLVKKAFASGHFSKEKKDKISDPAFASLDFIFQQPAISSVIIGTINAQHLQQNVAAAERIFQQHQ